MSVGVQRDEPDHSPEAQRPAEFRATAAVLKPQIAEDSHGAAGKPLKVSAHPEYSG